MLLLQMAQPAIGMVLWRLACFLQEETASAGRLREEMVAVREKLKRIECFLEDANHRTGRDKRMENRVNEICQVAYDIEDILDTFLAKVGPCKNNSKTKLKQLSGKPKELIYGLKLRPRIEKVKKKMDEISNSKAEFDIPGINEGADTFSETLGRRRRRESGEEQPNDIVGLQKEVDELVTRLVGGEAKRCVISVVGQAGIGKTVLARKVYNSAKSSFYHSAWLHVSKHMKVKEFLCELCKAVLSLSRDELNNLDESEMRRRTADGLKGKKYLVVLDDVWTGQAWDDIRGALPDEKTGSRVLMTTQNERVAKHADSQLPPYRLPLLNPRDSYDLLRRKAFPQPPHSVPDHLEGLAKGIVEKLGGLPLALVNIGGILSRRNPTTEAWKHVIDGLNWELTSTQSDTASILNLSLDDLPYYLKSCLLYCCAFPGDSDIRVKRLLRLWIAEGFVGGQSERKLEAVAEDYLEELVDRSLIQPCKRTCFGQIKSCRVHHVVREMLVATAEKQNFLRVDLTANGNVDASKCRRLAIHQHPAQERPALHNVRSFISFEKSESTIRYDPIIRHFKLLRVLDLEGLRTIKTLPKEIGDLVLLRYLGLRHTSIETLPRSTKKLYNLQTLDLRTSVNFRFGKFPLHDLKDKHVKKHMTNLRHLYFGNRHNGGLLNSAMEVTNDFGANNALTELQTLSYVKAGGWMEQGLCNMSKLQKLGLQVTDGYRSGMILNAISKLSDIYSLYLQGSLEYLPTNAFRKLTKLTLDSSNLDDEDPMLKLRTLESLKSLSLKNNAYKGKTMRCSVGGFPSLEVLNIEKLELLEDMDVDPGAFVQLRYMRIAACRSFYKIPKGLQEVKLKELKLIDMEVGLVARVHRGEGEDWNIIRHIESIIVTTFPRNLIRLLTFWISTVHGSAVEREFDIAHLS
ncbi:unnamed protein product [Victoria cruziana]